MAGTQSVEINCETGEVTYHDLTAEELAQREADAVRANEELAAMEAALAKRTEDKASGEAKLAELGLSADEIAALIG